MTKTKRPTITRREASRRVAEAGAAAYQQAASSGGDPKAITALLDAERVDLVAGIKVRPLLLETFLILEELWRLDAHINAPGTLQQSLTLYVYVQPVTARALFASPEKLMDAVHKWSRTITAQQFGELCKLTIEHLAAFYGASASEPSTPKKKRPARLRSGQAG